MFVTFPPKVRVKVVLPSVGAAKVTRWISLPLALIAAEFDPKAVSFSARKTPSLIRVAAVKVFAVAPDRVSVPAPCLPRLPKAPGVVSMLETVAAGVPPPALIRVTPIAAWFQWAMAPPKVMSKAWVPAAVTVTLPFSR